MKSEELGAVLFVLGYGALLVGAIRVFGIRRVLVVLFGIVFLQLPWPSRVSGSSSLLGGSDSRRIR